MAPEEITSPDISEPSYTLTQARTLVFHILYMMECHNYETSLEKVVDNLNRGYDQHISLDSDIVRTAQNIMNARDELDEIIKPFLEHWRIERLGLCTRIILHMGTWELLHTKEPASIIINEAIELAKDFTEKDAYKFINGILDQIAEKNKA